jgi:hypothetical protein
MSKDPPDWHLKEWASHFGKKQSSLVNELGWEKSRAHHVWHSKQSYRREDINAISDWLGIEPHELLMSPRDALSLRRLRQTAQEIIQGLGK